MLCIYQYIDQFSSLQAIFIHYTSRETQQMIRFNIMLNMLKPDRMHCTSYKMCCQSCVYTLDDSSCSFFHTNIYILDATMFFFLAYLCELAFFGQPFPYQGAVVMVRVDISP